MKFSVSALALVVGVMAAAAPVGGRTVKGRTRGEGLMETSKVLDEFDDDIMEGKRSLMKKSKSKSKSKSSKSDDDKCSEKTVEECCEPSEPRKPLPCVAIVRFDAINPSNEFDFVALSRISKGTKITFTDYGWKQDDAGFLTTEPSDSPLEWIAPEDILPGKITTVQKANINAKGDQIFAIQGSIDEPIFLYGLNWNGNSVWQDTAGDNLSSALPSQLSGTNMEAAVGNGSDGQINGKYTGTTMGTKETLLNEIHNQNNWSVGNSDPGEFSSGFTVLTTDAGSTPSIAIVRIANNAGIKQFEFVALDSIAKDSVISFTDYGWKAIGGFNDGTANDGVYDWTAPTDFTAGEVITILQSDSDATFLQKVNLNADQLFAYQGPPTDPKFLYGINFGKNDLNAWQEDATNESTSSLPTDLGNDTSVVVGTSGNNNNYMYIGTLCGTKEELLAKISNSDNWQRSGSDLLSRGGFTVTP